MVQNLHHATVIRKAHTGFAALKILDLYESCPIFRRCQVSEGRRRSCRTLAGPHCGPLRPHVVALPKALRASKRGVFAGGDIVTGAAIVIPAMGAGRKAVLLIYEYLRTEMW